MQKADILVVQQQLWSKLEPFQASSEKVASLNQATQKQPGEPPADQTPGAVLNMIKHAYVYGQREHSNAKSLIWRSVDCSLLLEKFRDYLEN